MASIVPKGIELEGTVAFNENLSLRAQATFQNSKAIEYKTWISSGVNASQDVLLIFGKRNRQQCTSHVWSYADVSKANLIPRSTITTWVHDKPIFRMLSKCQHLVNWIGALGMMLIKIAFAGKYQ
jgi:hypothetical protein